MEKLESRTVYFLESFGGRGAGHGLYEVKMEGGRVVGKSGELLDLVSMFFDGSNPEVPSMYLLGATRFGGRSKLYLLQHEGHSSLWLRESSTRSYDSYKGCIFGTMTKELMPFKLPNQIKKAALLISAYGKLYHLAYPSAYRSMSGIPDPSFEVYDPDTGSWSRLSAFRRYHMTWCNIDIIGYAVCYDCILISLGGHERAKGSKKEEGKGMADEAIQHQISKASKNEQQKKGDEQYAYVGFGKLKMLMLNIIYTLQKEASRKLEEKDKVKRKTFKRLRDLLKLEATGDRQIRMSESLDRLRSEVSSVFRRPTVAEVTSAVLEVLMVLELFRTRG
ncbi:hypothetical protein M0R45_024361 [Rubus argutus]|uniref:Uncharacterized protein n=1 Tax=Rubus argutus TaxID=59490 RepID=A0AAW1WS73_RUBAR